jgi:hypothetical protein
MEGLPVQRLRGRLACAGLETRTTAGLETGGTKGAPYCGNVLVPEM